AEAGAESSALSELSEPAKSLLAGTPGMLTEQDLSLLATTTIESLKTLAERGRVPSVLLDDADRIDATSWSLIRRVVLHPERPPGLWIETRCAAGSRSGSEMALWVEAGIAQ